MTVVLEPRDGFRKLTQIPYDRSYLDIALSAPWDGSYWDEGDPAIPLKYTKVRFIFKEWIIPTTIALFVEVDY